MDPAAGSENVTPPQQQPYFDYSEYQYIPVQQRPSRANRVAVVLIVTLVCSAIAATLSYSIVGHSRDGGSLAVNRGARGPTAVKDLRPGDCFNDAFADAPFGSPAIANAPTPTTVDAVPCTAPHNGEAYGAYDEAGTKFPPTETLVRDSAEQCKPLLNAFVMDQLSLPKEAADRRYLPTQQTWDRGERRVTCYLRFPSGQQVRSAREDASNLAPEQVRYLQIVQQYNDLAAQLDPTTLDPSDPSGDESVWTDMRDLASKMPDVVKSETDALDREQWAPDVREAVDALLAVKAKALPVWRQAAQATTEEEFVGLLNQAESRDDHLAAVAVRVQLGLAAKEGQRPVPPGRKLYV